MKTRRRRLSNKDIGHFVEVNTSPSPSKLSFTKAILIEIDAINDPKPRQAKVLTKKGTLIVTDISEIATVYEESCWDMV